MVETIRKIGHAHRAEVERVLLDTPRQKSVPHADLATTYDPQQAVGHPTGSSRSVADWILTPPTDMAAWLERIRAKLIA